MIPSPRHLAPSVLACLLAVAPAGCSDEPAPPTRPAGAALTEAGSAPAELDRPSPGPRRGKDSEGFTGPDDDQNGDAQGEDPLLGSYVLVEVDDPSAFAALEASGFVLVETYPSISMAAIAGSAGLPPHALIRLLESHPEVLLAERDRGVQSPEARGMSVSFNDGSLMRPDVDTQPYLDRLRVHEAHAIATGAGIRVAILDTGVDPGHPDLAGRIAGGWDSVDRDDDPRETADGVDNDLDGLIDEGFGHGTHLAGTVAQLAPGAELLIYRVLDDEGHGRASKLAEAVTRATDEGAHVINLSLGLYHDFRAVEKAVAYAEQNGVVIVASVGNDGSILPGQYPALYPDVVAVGSADEHDALSSFSSYGPHLWVTAPGELVLSLYPGGGYAGWSGSSMAAAVVSALSALIEETGTELEPRDTRNRLAGSVVPNTGLVGMTGHGRVGFLDAVQ